MMWLHLIFVVQLIGFQWPLLSAQVYPSPRPNSLPGDLSRMPVSPSHPPSHHHVGLIPGIHDVPVINNVVPLFPLLGSGNPMPHSPVPSPRPPQNLNQQQLNQQQPIQQQPNQLQPIQQQPIQQQPIQQQPIQQQPIQQQPIQQQPNQLQPNQLQPNQLQPIQQQPNQQQPPVMNNQLVRSLGVAIINDINDGPLCSGTHLKPWFLVAPAACLLKKDLRGLYATVTYRMNSTGTLHRRNVPVVSYQVYNEHGYPPDFAVVAINGNPKWDVDEFNLPPHTRNINEWSTTYVDEWKAHNGNNHLTSRRAYIAMINDICKPFSTRIRDRDINDNFYCVYGGISDGVQNQVDVGIPFYEKLQGAGGKRFYLGMYTGENLNKQVAGHLFLRSGNTLSWLNEKLRQYTDLGFGR